jgi:DNA processing protein
MTKEEYNFWLAGIHNIGIKKIELLLRIFKSAKEIFHAPPEKFRIFKEECCPAGMRFTDADIASLCGGRDEEKIHAKYAKLEENGIYFVSREDERYPARLQGIYGAPFGLYVKGRLPGKEEKLLAVVGARECSPYGKEMAKYLAGAVAGEGISIVSGLARGIDSHAHEGALLAGGITYAVLGCGIDICYPRENINLYMELQKKGGIISEYAPGTKPLAGNFPMRNRIISGLCDAILVVEAREKSGSLITADLGLEQGRDIFALPGKATDRLSDGCNNLIKMGAKLVTAPRDILEELLPNYKETTLNLKKNNKLLELEEKIVYASLCLEPKHIEDIALRTGLPMDLLMERLLRLELKGYVRQTMKNYYVAQD